MSHETVRLPFTTIPALPVSAISMANVTLIAIRPNQIFIPFHMTETFSLLHERPFILVTLRSSYRLSPTPSFLQCVALCHFQFLHLKYQYHLTHPSVSYTGSWHDRANLDLSQLLRDLQYPTAVSGINSHVRQTPD